MPVDELIDSAAELDTTAPSDRDQPRSPSEVVRTRDSQMANRSRSRQQEWREEFPYHWRADDLVTRRDTLRFLVAGSGALFLASATLAVIGAVRLPTQGRPLAIPGAAALAENESLVFTYPDQYAQGIVVNLPNKGLVAYSDVCTHLSCAVLYEKDTRRFHCPCHEGYFDAYTGNALAGPPVRPLPVIELAVRNGVIYAMREVER
ncbi:MAG: ubiquinol-cytochrome c reductase iron-sulfur subunit [Ktedonobacterales bacterium]